MATKLPKHRKKNGKFSSITTWRDAAGNYCSCAIQKNKMHHNLK